MLLERASVSGAALNFSASKIQQPAENTVAVAPHRPKTVIRMAEKINGIIWLMGDSDTTHGPYQNTTI
jgi:hypothetical protein